MYERLAAALTPSRDMAVNLARIGDALNVRDKMMDMEKQVQAFVDFVREEMGRALSNAPDSRLGNAIVRFRPPRVSRVEK
jgi:hypothetical protein